MHRNQQHGYIVAVAPPDPLPGTVWYAGRDPWLSRTYATAENAWRWARKVAADFPESTVTVIRFA